MSTNFREVLQCKDHNRWAIWLSKINKATVWLLVITYESPNIISTYHFLNANF